MRFVEPDEIVAPIVGWPQHHVDAGLLQSGESVGQQAHRECGAVAVDGQRRLKALGEKEEVEDVVEPLPKVGAPLRY